jgi:hypothetical protein
MAQMSVNYGNPTQSFAQGAQTGMALGSMWKRNKEDQNAGTTPMAVAGERQQIDINQLTQQEQADSAKYKDIEKNAKGNTNDFSRNLNDYEIRQAAMKETQSPVVQKLIQSGLPAQKIDSFLKAVSTNPNPESAPMIALKNLLPGKDKDPAWIALNNKIAEIKNTQKQLDTEYSNQVKNSLLAIKQYYDNPKEFTNKFGRVHPTTEQAISKDNYYIQQMTTLDPEWLKQYLAERQKGKVSGGTDKSVILSGYNTKTKKWETGRYYSPEEWKSKNPDMDIGSMAFTPKKDEFSSLLRTGEDTPNPFKEGAKQNAKPMTKAIVDKYLKENKNDPAKATAAAKKDGYDTTKVVE